MKKTRTFDQMPLDFMVPQTSWRRPECLPTQALNQRLVALDCETRDDALSAQRGPGWAWGAGKIIGVSAAWDGGAGYYPIAHPDTDNFDHEQVGRWLGEVISTAGAIVMQNAPYDVGWFGTEWPHLIPIMERARIHDTLAEAVCIDENRHSYRLSSLLSWRGLPMKEDTLLKEAGEAFGFGAEYMNFLWKMPARFVGEYAEWDAAGLLPLHHSLQGELAKQDLNDAYLLESDLIAMCVAMRRRGIRIDGARVDSSRAELLNKRDEALAVISRNATIGRDVTIDDVRSAVFLEALFDDAGLPYPKTPKTERGSFKGDWMDGHEHWLPSNVAIAREAADAADKFMEGFLTDYRHRGRIHAEIHQYRNDSGGTRSHRFSYANPPLQQMPGKKHPELMQFVRRCFLPEEGDRWYSLDYSQQEFRLMVHFGVLMDMPTAHKAAQKFIDDPTTDFHTLVAELTGLPRRQAKDVNFAKAFGAGVAKFASMTGLPLDEAKRRMEQYDTEMPFIKDLASITKAAADRRGYIRMLDGARGHFDDFEPSWRDNEVEYVRPCPRPQAFAHSNDPNHPWYRKRLRRAFTHKALNRLIQGSAARFTKLAMRSIWREGVVPMLQMHDELNFTFSEDGPARRMEQLMATAAELKLPMLVDVSSGDNWGDQEELDD